MDGTFEGIQHEATPAITGPLKVYFVLTALVLAMVTEAFVSHLLAVGAFVGLTIHAVGVRPVRWVGLPLTFILPGIGIILLTTPGRPLFEWWQVTITAAGVNRAFTTIFRSLAALSILSFLALTTPIQTVVGTLQRWPVPGIIVELFLYIYRAIQVTFGEAMEMRTASAARLGFRDRRTTYRTIKLIASALLVRTFDRIERFGDALQSRNYDGTVPVATEVESTGHRHAVAILALILLGAWV